MLFRNPFLVDAEEVGKDLKSLPNDIKCNDTMRSKNIPISIPGFYQTLENTKLSLVTLEIPISFSAFCICRCSAFAEAFWV